MILVRFVVCILSDSFGFFFELGLRFVLGIIDFIRLNLIMVERISCFSIVLVNVVVIVIRGFLN